MRETAPETFPFGEMVPVPLVEGNFAEEFARIKAPIYTIWGNHEYIGHEPEAEQFFADAGITLLRDSVARFEGLTDAMYEKSWGHHQRGSTRYYVSSGLGIWGPKIRIGTRSEYLVLHIDQAL